VDATTVRRDHDGDLASVLAMELAQSSLRGASAAR
jgi:hypothetical protein